MVRMRRQHYKPYLAQHGIVSRPAPVTNGIAARYERFSHSGTTWFDVTPAPADGTLSGDGSWWPNFVTGNSNYVAVGNPAKLDFSGAFTISLWGEQNPAPPVQGGEYLIGKDGLQTGRDVGVSMLDNNALISGFLFSPGAKFVQYAPPVKGNMHHIVFVNEGAGNDLHLYVDGELRATNAGNGASVAWHATTPWEFGRRQNDAAGTPDDYLTGQMDTVRFYSRALSADEILNDYNAGKPEHP